MTTKLDTDNAVINHKADGTTETIIPVVDVTVTEGTEVIVNDDDLTQAVKFVASYMKRGKKDRTEWANLGKVLTQAKKSVNGNTKIYGQWAKETFPALSASNKSYSIKLYEDFDFIEEWASEYKPDLHTPQHVYQSCKKFFDDLQDALDGKTDEEPDKGDGDKEVEETPIENLLKSFDNVGAELIKRQTDTNTNDRALIQDVVSKVQAMLDAYNVKQAA